MTFLALLAGLLLTVNLACSGWPHPGPTPPSDPACVPVALVNGSFEEPAIVNRSRGWDRLGSDFAELPGWTGNIDLHLSSDLPVAPDGGEQVIDLNQNGAGSLAQSVTLVAGAQYELSFFHGTNYHCTGQAEFAVEIGGVRRVFPSSGASGAPLQQERIFFIAKEADTALTFTSLTGGCGATTIDNVELSCSDAPRTGSDAGRFANSDPWLVTHHEALRELRPRVLVLNFANGRDAKPAVDLLAQALSEGSRYRGYLDAAAKPFLSYEIARIVDLRDAGATSGSSSLAPRKTPDPMYAFDYGALFNRTFAERYGYYDGTSSGSYLTLCDLLSRGEVNEVWLYLDAADPNCPNGAEMLEQKQVYDAYGLPVAGRFACTGNGCFDNSDLVEVSKCGRTVRILVVDATRGVGVALESLNHGIEGLFSAAAVPPFTEQAAHFLNFDLKSRLGLPFRDWLFSCPYNGAFDCVTFTGQNALTWSVPTASPATGTVDPYNQGCGSVHFPSNGRSQYDYDNAFQVLTTCEHYGLRDGTPGADATSLYPPDPASASGHALANYKSLYENEGGWHVYWRQSFPGLGTHAVDQAGHPILQWWPYLYY